MLTSSSVWKAEAQPSVYAKFIREALFVLKVLSLLWYAEIRNQLVEQFRCLEQQSESRLQLLQDLQEFFRRKAELQLEYSRGLDKLAERYSAKIRTSREHQHFKWVSTHPVLLCTRMPGLTSESDISFWSLPQHRKMERKRQRGRQRDDQTRMRGGIKAEEMTWNVARAKEACGLRLLCFSQLGQTLYPLLRPQLPPLRLFCVAVISFLFSSNITLDCCPNTRRSIRQWGKKQYGFFSSTWIRLF